MAAWRKASQNLFDGFNNSKCRVYWVNYPTAQDAALAKMDLVAYKQMVANAMEADYSKISSQADALKKLLVASKSIKVTTPDGTNLSLSVSGRPVIVSDGVISKGDASNKLLALFKDLEADHYQNTKGHFRKSSQREHVIKRFINQFKIVLATAIKEHLK